MLWDRRPVVKTFSNPHTALPFLKYRQAVGYESFPNSGPGKKCLFAPLAIFYHQSGMVEGYDFNLQGGLCNLNKVPLVVERNRPLVGLHLYVRHCSLYVLIVNT